VPSTVDVTPVLSSDFQSDWSRWPEAIQNQVAGEILWTDGNISYPVSKYNNSHVQRQQFYLYIFFLGNELGYFAVRKNPYGQIIAQGGMNRCKYDYECIQIFTNRPLLGYADLLDWTNAGVSSICSAFNPFQFLFHLYYYSWRLTCYSLPVTLSLQIMTCPSGIGVVLFRLTQTQLI